MPRRSRGLRDAAPISLLIVAGAWLTPITTRAAAQSPTRARDSARVLLVELTFGPTRTDSASVHLERRVVYWAEMTGPGTPVFQPVDDPTRTAFVVPIDPIAGPPGRRFEVYPVRSGPHLVTVTALPAGAAGTLRLYEDVEQTRRMTEKRDRRFGVGALVAGGFHSGYRLDPTGGVDPRGGGDLEGCLLVEAAGRIGGCIGAAWQGMPDATYDVAWLFLELRVRALTRPLLGKRRTDFGLVLRLSQAMPAGPRSLDPQRLGLGLYVTQHLAGGGQRRGWSLSVAWHHERLVHAPETERLNTDRFTAGLIWLP